MAQVKLVARLNQIVIRHFAATATGMYCALGIFLGILGLGVLATALYLAPKPATLGLVLLGLGLPIVLMLWHRPEFGLLALIFLTSSLVPANVVDLRLPIGGLELRDLVFIGMLGLLALRGLFRGTLSIQGWHISAPLLVLLGFAIFSTLYALLFQHVEANWVLSEFRGLVYFCVFFITCWAVTNRRQLAIMLAGLFIIADLITGVLILQQFLGVNNPLLAAMSFSNWRLYEEGPTLGAGGFGMVRIMPPGIVLPYFMMIAALCLVVFTHHNSPLRTVLGLQVVFLSFGLLLTYTRALWIAVVIAVGLVLVALFTIHRARLVRYLAIGAVLLGLIVGLLNELQQSLANSAIVTATFARFLSILTPEETLGSLSLQGRVFETEAGLRSVLEHPLLGVGLGNSYRRVSTFLGEAAGYKTGSLAAGEVSRFTRFIHNSYLSTAVKMGLPALASLLWFCVAVVIDSAVLFRNLPEGQPRAIALAVLSSFVGLMLWSAFHQHFEVAESIAVVGLMAGLVVSIRSIWQ